MRFAQITNYELRVVVKKVKNVGADLCVSPSKIDHVQIEENPTDPAGIKYL